MQVGLLKKTTRVRGLTTDFATGLSYERLPTYNVDRPPALIKINCGISSLNARDGHAHCNPTIISISQDTLAFSNGDK